MLILQLTEMSYLPIQKHIYLGTPLRTASTWKISLHCGCIRKYCCSGAACRHTSSYMEPIWTQLSKTSQQQNRCIHDLCKDFKLASQHATSVCRHNAACVEAGHTSAPKQIQSAAGEGPGGTLRALQQHFNSQTSQRQGQKCCPALHRIQL